MANSSMLKPAYGSGVGENSPVAEGFASCVAGTAVGVPFPAPVAVGAEVSLLNWGGGSEAVATTGAADQVRPSESWISLRRLRPLQATNPIANKIVPAMLKCHALLCIL